MATTPAKRACPVCGALLADDSTFCPVCALQQALGTQTYFDSNSSSELRFEHYTVLQNAEGKPLELGRGAMGVTYKALDVNLRCAVALKVISARLVGDESARRRFVREARAAASVRHPNVASVFYLGKSDDGYFYAMEYVEALADQIVDVVASNLPDNPGTTEIDNIEDGCGPAGIDSISVTRFPKQTSASFFAPRSAWIPKIDAGYLQRTIDEKSTRLKGYLNACDEAWLLMVEEGTKLSNTIEMPDELWKLAYDFRGFARLFVLRGTQTIHELRGN